MRNRISPERGRYDHEMLSKYRGMDVDPIPTKSAGVYELVEPREAWKGLIHRADQPAIARVILPKGTAICRPDSQKIRVDQMLVERIWLVNEDRVVRSAMSPVVKGYNRTMYRTGKFYTTTLNTDPRTSCGEGFHVCRTAGGASFWAHE